MKKNIIWLEKDYKIVKIFNLDNGDIIENISIITEQFVASSGKYFANFHTEKEICIKDKNGNILYQIQHNKSLQHGYFINNEDLFLAIDNMGQILVIDIINGNKTLYFTIDIKKDIQNISCSPDNDFISYKADLPTEIFDWKGNKITSIGTLLRGYGYGDGCLYSQYIHTYWPKNSNFFYLHFYHNDHAVFQLFSFESKKSTVKQQANFKKNKAEFYLSLGKNIDKIHETRDVLKSIIELNDTKLSNLILSLKSI